MSSTNAIPLIQHPAKLKRFEVVPFQMEKPSTGREAFGVKP